MSTPKQAGNGSKVRGQVLERTRSVPSRVTPPSCGANITFHTTKRSTSWSRPGANSSLLRHRSDAAPLTDLTATREIERLIEAAYHRSSRYGLMVKTLFYTGARVSEFVHIQVHDLHLSLDPPQIYLAHAKGGSDGYVPILPVLAQELRTHLAGRQRGYLFESNRHDKYTPRYIQRVVHEVTTRAELHKRVTPHRLRASVATILLDAGMPLDQVQKFLRHKRITTTQIYAETSVRSMGEQYIRAFTQHEGA